MEHWLYLPIIGIALILVWLGAAVAQAWSRLQKPLAAAFAIILTLLSAKTISRNKDWRDPITFYNQTLRYAPESYRILNNLGMAYADAGSYEKAAEIYQHAITLDPTNPVAYHNLGNTYKATGRRELAIESFRTAIHCDPKFYFSYNALADIYLKEGNYQETRKVFEAYLDYSPSKTDTLLLLAQIAVEERDLDRALTYLENALAIDPGNKTIKASIVQLEGLIKSQTE